MGLFKNFLVFMIVIYSVSIFLWVLMAHSYASRSSRYKYTINTLRDHEYSDIRDCPKCQMKKTKICIAVMIHKFRRERHSSFSMYIDGKKIEYVIMHVYSNGDDYPKDNRGGFVVFPDFIDYTNFLRKVWLGISYFRNEECDFVMKMDDDVFVDWYQFSNIMANKGPNDWIGEYEERQLRADRDPNNKYTGVKFYRYVRRENYYDFMYGQFYGWGKELYKCVINEIERRMVSEKGRASQWIELHLEDVGMGIILQNCPSRNINDLKKHFYGEEHNLPPLANATALPIIYIQAIPPRESEEPLWEAIWSDENL